MCRFTYYYLLKWFQDDMNKICVKFAAKRVFFHYFNVNFITSQRRQFSSDFVEITFIQQRMSLRSYSYQINALSQLIYKALTKKNCYPPKLPKSVLFPVFASPQHKNVDSQKKFVFAKMTAIQFPQISRNHGKQNFCVFENNWKNLEWGVVTTPSPPPFAS